METCRLLGKKQKRKASVFVCATSKERKKESIGGSVGSRDERESTEEGCGRVVFTGLRDSGRCGFVHQHLHVYHGLPQ